MKRSGKFYRNNEKEIMRNNIDTCVCCGEYVPEGRQVCWSCEHGIPIKGGDAQ